LEEQGVKEVKIFNDNDSVSEALKGERSTLHEFDREKKNDLHFLLFRGEGEKGNNPGHDGPVPTQEGREKGREIKAKKLRFNCQSGGGAVIHDSDSIKKERERAPRS